MYSWYLNEKIAEVRRADHILRASRHRLLQSVGGKSARRVEWQARAMARVGALLVNWGQRLQARQASLAKAGVGASIPNSTARPCVS
jgi:hypothetical protein